MSDLVPSSLTPHSNPLAQAHAANAYALPALTYPVADHQAEAGLAEFLLVLRKRKILIISTVIAFIAVAIILYFVLTPQYKATATVQINQDETDMGLGSLSGLAPAVTAEDELKTELGTHIGVLGNDTIALAVYHDLKLKDRKPFAYRDNLIDKLTGDETDFEAELDKPIENAPHLRDRFLKIWRKKLTVKAEPDTRLIDVTFKNPDPQLAAAIANDVVQQYVTYYLQLHYQATAQASSWLSSQLGQLKARVAESEKRVADYQKKTGIPGMALMSAVPSGPGASGLTAPMHVPVLDKLDLLNQQLTAAETSRVAKEAIYKLTQTQSPDVVLGLSSSGLSGVAGSSVLSDGSGLGPLQALRAQQTNLRIALADVSTKYGQNNPRVLEAKNQLAAIDSEIATELDRINKRAENDVVLAKQNEEGIRSQFEQQQVQANKLNDGAVQLAVLTQEAASSRALYEDLYGKLQAANLAAGQKATNIMTADPARPPSKPWMPDLPIFLGAGVGVGLLVGIASAFIRENLDTAVITPVDAEAIARLQVLSSIPLVSKKSLRSASPALVAIEDVEKSEERSPLLVQPASLVAESYRSLRTSLLLSLPPGKPAVLLVTSPLANDGKTTVTYNLGVAFAQKGLRVTIIDADLRKPRQHEMFNTTKLPGLSDALTSRATSPRALLQRHSTLSNLSLLPAGPEAPLPVELLASDRFDEIVAELRVHSDLVLIDSSPLLFVTDAAVLAHRADVTLAVVRSGRTNRLVLSRMSEVLSRCGAASVGLVLNAIDTESASHYYAHGYYGRSYNAEHITIKN